MHTEDIALKCHQLFPASFSWVRHPELPDKDIVRVALTDARKDRYGALVEGRTGQSRGQTTKTKRMPAPDGWILTPRGIMWIHDNADHLEVAADASQPRAHRQQVLRQLKRIREHPLYLRFIDTPAHFYPSLGEIADFLRCRVDAEPEIWNRRFSSLRRQAQSANHPEVLSFLASCEEAYAKQRD